MQGIDYKQLAYKRLEALNKIRLTIKRHLPNAFPPNCLQPAMDEVLESIFKQGTETEKGRNAFRDELIRLGYQHADLVALVEKPSSEAKATLGERFEFAKRHTE